MNNNDKTESQNNLQVNGRFDENRIFYKDVALTDIPLEDIKENPDKIISVGLHNNNLGFVPDSLFNLSNLELINISKNPIQFIPDNFFLLNKVKFLSICDCELTEISPLIINMTALFSINLAGNLLTKLPPEIFCLQDLRFVILDRNQFKRLEVWDDTNYHNKNVSLIDNPMEEEDDDTGLYGKKTLRQLFGERISFTKEEKLKNQKLASNQIPKYLSILKQSLEVRILLIKVKTWFLFMIICLLLFGIIYLFYNHIDLFRKNKKIN